MCAHKTKWICISPAEHTQATMMAVSKNTSVQISWPRPAPELPYVRRQAAPHERRHWKLSWVPQSSVCDHWWLLPPLLGSAASAETIRMKFRHTRRSHSSQFTTWHGTARPRDPF